jgi:hypothetical protein
LNIFWEEIVASSTTKSYGKGVDPPLVFLSETFLYNIGFQEKYRRGKSMILQGFRYGKLL